MSRAGFATISGFLLPPYAAFAGLDLLPQTQFVEALKDEKEIATIRKVQPISDRCDALDFIKPGKTEIEIANFLTSVCVSWEHLVCL